MILPTVCISLPNVWLSWLCYDDTSLGIGGATAGVDIMSNIIQVHCIDRKSIPVVTALTVFAFIIMLSSFFVGALDKILGLGSTFNFV